MGLLDSLKEAIRPAADPRTGGPQAEDSGTRPAPGMTGEGRHADRSSEALGRDPSTAGAPSGGKHARRD